MAVRRALADIPLAVRAEAGVHLVRQGFDALEVLGAVVWGDATAVYSGNRPPQLQDQSAFCVHGHEFTEENTYYRSNGRHRLCRTCNRLRQRKHHRKEAA